MKRLVGVIVLGVCIALALLDRNVSHSDDFGFFPAASRWTVHATDFPAFLEGIQETEAYERVRFAAALPARNFWLDTRRGAGIRPTPARFRHWLGHQLVAGWDGNSWGVCVRPGLALRTASFLAGTRNEGVTHTWKDFTYAWRDGYLIASRSPEYVAACLTPDARRPETRTVGSEATIQHFGEPQLEVTIEGAPGLPCRGIIHRAVATSPAPLTLVDALPGSPVVSIAGKDPADVLDILTDLVRDSSIADYLTQTLDAMKTDLPEDFAGEGNEFVLALHGVDLSEDIPIPELVLVLRGDTAGLLPEQPGGALPFRWSDVPGWIHPWLGEKLSFCVAAAGRTRYLATQERLMPGIVQTLSGGAVRTSDAAVSIDWKRGAPIARDILMEAAELELVPRMNRGDVERDIVPYLDMLAALGRAELAGTSAEGTLSFEGKLASP